MVSACETYTRSTECVSRAALDAGSLHFPPHSDLRNAVMTDLRDPAATMLSDWLDNLSDTQFHRVAAAVVGLVKMQIALKLSEESSTEAGRPVFRCCWPPLDENDPVWYDARIVCTADMAGTATDSPDLPAHGGFRVWGIGRRVVRPRFVLLRLARASLLLYKATHKS